MKNERKVTMDDIAQKAGVTQATVSHVINGTAKISETVTKRVLRAAKELEYVPKKWSRVSRDRVKKTIGLLIPDVENGFYAEIAKGVETAMRRRGFMMFQCNTFYKSSYEKNYIKTLLQYNVSGVIVGYPMASRESYNILLENHLPTIIVDDRPKGMEELFSSVEINNLLGGQLAAEHLEKLGGKQICIASEPVISSALEHRINGFCHMMADMGKPIKNEYIYIEDSQYGKMEMGYNIGAKILVDGSIDAIFATSDHVAFGIMKRLKEHNVRFPEDVMIMGYDDVNFAHLMEPSLTTISQPIDKLAEKGAELLYENINNYAAEIEHITMDPCLVIRNSTMRIE